MLQRAIRWGDGEMLFNLFTRTRAIRRSIVDAGEDSAEPNFGRIRKNSALNTARAERRWVRMARLCRRRGPVREREVRSSPPS